MWVFLLLFNLTFYSLTCFLNGGLSLCEANKWCCFVVISEDVPAHRATVLYSLSVLGPHWIMKLFREARTGLLYSSMIQLLVRYTKYLFSIRLRTTYFILLLCSFDHSFSFFYFYLPLNMCNIGHTLNSRGTNNHRHSQVWHFRGISWAC